MWFEYHFDDYEFKRKYCSDWEILKLPLKQVEHSLWTLFLQKSFKTSFYLKNGCSLWMIFFNCCLSTIDNSGRNRQLTFCSVITWRRFPLRVCVYIQSMFNEKIVNWQHFHLTLNCHHSLSRQKEGEPYAETAGKRITAVFFNCKSNRTLVTGRISTKAQTVEFPKMKAPHRGDPTCLTINQVGNL